MFKKRLSVAETEIVSNNKVVKNQPVVFLNYDRVSVVSRQDIDDIWSLSLDELLARGFLLKGFFSRMHDEKLLEVIDEKKGTQCVFYKDIFPLDERWTDLLKNLVMAAIDDRRPGK